MRNRYPGTCPTCSCQVPEGAGFLLRESGRWRTYCAEHAPAAEVAPPRGDHPGWHTTPLVGFDCETSTADPHAAFLVSAALAGPDDAMRAWLVDPGDRAIPEEATAIHGITTEHARGAGRPAAEVLEEVATALCDHLGAGHGLVIFNAPYDLTVMEHELLRYGLPSLAQRLGGPIAPVVDPLVLDRELSPARRGRRNLAAVCEYYAVRLTDAHTAEADAGACLALAREIGARHEELARLPLSHLHKRQEEWARSRAARRQRWMDRNRPGHGVQVDGTWPLSEMSGTP